MPTLYLALDRATGEPVHRQIREGIRRAILDGRLRPGQRVPSTRALAAELRVSRLPVLNAYEQLLHEGYLTGRTGSGTFVSHAVPDELLEPASGPGYPARAKRDEAFERPASTTWHLPAVPFQVGIPALDLFPHSAWKKLLVRQVKAESTAQLSYTDPAGFDGLRISLAEHLRSARAVRCEAPQVLIVPGSQAALRITASALLQPGDRVAIEDPGYFGAQRAFRASGVELVPIPVDPDGLQVRALRKRGRGVRAVYVTPSHQYPLGVTMSVSRRFELLEWANEHDAWIVEDDYDSEFRHVSRPIPALQGMDTRDRVIYVGTFSKSLVPEVRMGYLVVPPNLWERFYHARFAFDFLGPTIYQRAIAEFLRDGHFARHLRQMRGVYLERRMALLQGLERNCGKLLAVHNADAGLHVAVMCSGEIDDVDLVSRLRLKGLGGLPLSTTYIGTPRRKGLLLGYGCTTPQRLVDATRVLGDLLRRAG